MRPLVSILIPAYNAERWLAETLQSALAQTWKRKEIIVVNDGSGDKTLDVARRFESAAVRVVTQESSGAAAARNTALSLSSGDYIQWLDADDLLARDKIELQVAAALRLGDNHALVSGAWAWFTHDPASAKFTASALWADLEPAEWLVRKLGLNLHMQTATWLTSRELTAAAGPWDTEMWVDDDGEYFCRVLRRASGIHFVPEAKVFYRMTDATRLSHIGFSDRKKEAMMRSIRIHIDTLRSLEDTPRTRAACVGYIQNWLIYFYPERPDLVSEAEALAAELGGHLEAPKLSWKYSWIKTLAGWRAAKRAQVFLPAARESAAAFIGNVFCSPRTKPQR